MRRADSGPETGLISCHEMHVSFWDKSRLGIAQRQGKFTSNINW